MNDEHTSDGLLQAPAQRLAVTFTQTLLDKPAVAPARMIKVGASIGGNVD
jgi:hypothetical protein